MNGLTVVILVVVLAVPASFAASAVATARGAGRWVTRDRVDVVSQLSSSVAFLAAGHVLLPWQELPTALWGLAVALTAFGALTSAFVLRELPVTRPGRGRATAFLGAAGNALFAVAIIALTAV